MANQNADTVLTTYETKDTILTADVANMWFGGLYGTADGASLPVSHPLVAGHVHDGLHKDGHAQKINLQSHVTGQLINVNLADDSVMKRNVLSFVDQSQAIPEFDGDGYKLDLSGLRNEVSDIEDSIVWHRVGTMIRLNSNANPATDSFLFGYSSNDSNYFQFLKSKGSFFIGKDSNNMFEEIGDNSLVVGDYNLGYGDGPSHCFIFGAKNSVEGSNTFTFGSNASVLNTNQVTQSSQFLSENDVGLSQIESYVLVGTSSSMQGTSSNLELSYGGTASELRLDNQATYIAEYRVIAKQIDNTSSSTQYASFVRRALIISKRDIYGDCFFHIVNDATSYDYAASTSDFDVNVVSIATSTTSFATPDCDVSLDVVYDSGETSLRVVFTTGNSGASPNTNLTNARVVCNLQLTKVKW